MRSDWAKDFATAGVALAMFNELENLEYSYQNKEVSQDAYEKRKNQLEKMLEDVINK